MHLELQQNNNNTHVHNTEMQQKFYLFIFNNYHISTKRNSNLCGWQLSSGLVMILLTRQNIIICKKIKYYVHHHDFGVYRHTEHIAK